MDFINKLTNNNGNNSNDGNQNTQGQHHSQQQNTTGGSGGGFMDKLNSFAGGQDNNNRHNQQTQGSSSGGGFMDKLNGLAGGGASGEKNEDALDKGVDWVQEHVMGQGPQDNESAIEQAKDERISDFIREKYKGTTGSDIPIKDKETRFG